jgi:predicted NBD/HSP70 family sugar kinase
MPTADEAPGSTASLRTANRHRVLDALRRHAGGFGPAVGRRVTQAELARVTGLAPATVSNIVREFSAAGLVATEPGSGRRGTEVRLSPGAGLVAGIDFGHSHVSVAVGDLTGDVLTEEWAPLDQAHHYEEGLSLAAQLLQASVQRLGFDTGTLRTIGMGLPAPMIGESVRSSTILPGWVGVNVRRVAEQRFGCVVHVENDANLGALAEHRVGAARDHNTSIFLKLSSGVGAGIIIDDQLFHGASGTAGEVGHLTVNDQGPVCRCGSRGCLEVYASSGSILDAMATQMPHATLDEVIAAAHTGNVVALRSIEEAGLNLGQAVGAIVNLLNPSLVVIGGDLARAGDLLLASTRVGLRRHALDAVAATPIVAGELGHRASLMGAVLLAAERTELLPAGLL